MQDVLESADKSPQSAPSNSHSHASLDQKSLSQLERSIQANQLDSLDYFPDGGLQAWLQVVGAFCLILNSWGIFSAYGAFQAFYEQGILKDSSTSAIAWVGSLQGFLLFFISAFAGPLFDMGYARAIIFTGSSLVTFGMMVTSLCTKYWQVMLAQGVVVGVGGGLVFVPGVAIVATYFKERRASATGITVTGTSIGGIIYTIALRKLSNQVGLPWATRIVGFIMLGIFAVSLAVLRPRPRRKTRRPFIDWSAWRDAPYAIFVVGMTIGFMSAYIPYFYIDTYAAARTAASDDLAFYFLAILNAASTAGRTIPNFIADKTGPLNILVPSVIVTGALGIVWIAARNVSGLLVWTVMFGFSSGTFVSLAPSSIASLTRDLSRVGTRMGMAFTLMGIGLLVGNPIAGALIDLHTNDFLHAQIFCGVLVLASGGVLAAARIAKVGWAIKVKA